MKCGYCSKPKPGQPYRVCRAHAKTAYVHEYVGILTPSILNGAVRKAALKAS